MRILGGYVEGELIHEDGSSTPILREWNTICNDSAFGLAWILYNMHNSNHFYLGIGDLNMPTVTDVTPIIADLADGIAPSPEQFHLVNEYGSVDTPPTDTRVPSLLMKFAEKATLDDEIHEFGSIMQGDVTVSNKVEITFNVTSGILGPVRELGLFIGPVGEQGVNKTPSPSDIDNHGRYAGGIMISRKIVDSGKLPMVKTANTTLTFVWTLYLGGPDLGPILPS